MQQPCGGSLGELQLNCANLVNDCQKLGDLVVGAGGHWAEQPAPEVFSLEMEVERVQGFIVILQTQCGHFVEGPPPRKTKGGAEVEADCGGSGRSDDDHESLSDDSGSDVLSIVASLDTEAETESDEFADQGDEDCAPPEEVAAPGDEERALPVALGTHTLFKNPYFTFTRDLKYTDVKVSILPRWAKPEELGSSLRSKTVQLSSHGGQQQAVWTLRAWMLFRSRESNWYQRVESRKLWYDAEELQLRRDMEAAALTPATRERVLQWAPAVLS